MTEVFSLVDGTVIQNYTEELSLPNSMIINGIGLALKNQSYCQTTNLGKRIDNV